LSRQVKETKSLGPDSNRLATDDDRDNFAVGAQGNAGRAPLKRQWLPRNSARALGKNNERATRVDGGGAFIDKTIGIGITNVARFAYRPTKIPTFP